MNQERPPSSEKQLDAESRSRENEEAKPADGEKHSAAVQQQNKARQEERDEAPPQETKKEADQEKFRLRCPYCKKRVKAYRRHLGRKVFCPVCQVPFLVQPGEEDGDGSSAPPVAIALPPEQHSLPQAEPDPLDADLELVEETGGFKLIVTCGIVGLMVLLALAAGAVLLVMRLAVPGQFVAEDSSFGWDRRSDQVPPPVRDALVLGRQVWRLDGFRLWNTPHGKCLYVVLDGRKLEEVVGVLELPAQQAQQFVGEKAAPGWGEVRLWFRMPAEEERKTFSDLQREIDSRWTFRQEEKSWLLQRNEKITTRRQITWLQETIRIVIDFEVGEGYWETDRLMKIKHRGAQAYLGTRVERKQERGGAFPVLLP